MSYDIYFYHGFSQKLADKLDGLSHTVSMDGEHNDEYMWNGSLDSFKEEYQDMFCVRDSVIWITPHSSWGAR